MPWLLSKASKIRDVPRWLSTRSAMSAAIEVGGAAGFIWGLHAAWAPLAGIVGGPLAILIGVAVDSPTGPDDR